MFKRRIGNPLLYLWLPFAPKRVKHVYNSHTLNKFYRLRSDYVPYLPQIDTWLYRYRPTESGVISDQKPIATKKIHWKVPHEARIIAFSLFGEKCEFYYRQFCQYLDSFSYIKHCNGIQDKLWGYETFTPRVYVAKRKPQLRENLGPLRGETPDWIIQELLDRGCEIVYVDNHLDHVGKDASFWRFLVAAEAMPDGQRIRYLLRDVDWKLTAAELFSVGEWIASGLEFHRAHLTPIFMGPLTAKDWGGTHVGLGRMPDLPTAMAYFPYRMEYGDDELFTRDVIWQRIKYIGSVLTHHYPKDWRFFLATPYLGSAEQPTQKYCDAIRKGGTAPDVLMPKDMVYPIIQLGLCVPLDELKKDPRNFDMQLHTLRGQRVRDALSVPAQTKITLEHKRENRLLSSIQLIPPDTQISL